MKKFRALKLFLLVILIVFAALSTRAVAAQDTITINFKSHDYAPREKIDREIIAQFEKDNPNIKVNYTIGPGDDSQYVPQILTAIAGDAGPDMFNILTFLVPDLISSGAVAPVDSKAMGYASDKALTDLYLPGRLTDFMGSDGKLYALPTEVGNYSLFINTDLFKKAGLDPAKDAPKTWEDLMKIAPKLTVKDASGNITQRAFDFAYPLPNEIVGGGLAYGGMAYQLGGTYFNKDKTAGAINTPAWVKTYTFVRDYAKQFGGPALEPSSIGFYEGNVAMVISGAWYSDVIRTNNAKLMDSVITSPFPRWTKEDGLVNDTGSLMYDYGLFVNSKGLWGVSW